MDETPVKEPETAPESVEAVAPHIELTPPSEPPAPATAELETKLAEAQKALSQRETEVQAIRHQLASATARYREALLASSPEVPAELVAGATPEEVEASLARARQVVEKVRSHLEARLAEQRVPTGAPIRSAPDLSAMSPQEKIAYALAQRERG